MAKPTKIIDTNNKALDDAVAAVEQFALEERDGIEKEDMQIEDLYARVYAEKRLVQLARYIESLKA